MSGGGGECQGEGQELRGVCEGEGGGQGEGQKLRGKGRVSGRRGEGQGEGHKLRGRESVRRRGRVRWRGCPELQYSYNSYKVQRHKKERNY